MVTLSISSDLNEAEAKLKKLGYFIPNINKKILKRLATKGRSELRSAYKRSGLQEYTGKLFNGIYMSVKTSEAAYVGVISKQAYKFIPLNYGMRITPKKHGKLVFRGYDGWVRVSEVTIPARNFFGALERYLGSSRIYKDINAVLDREVKKVMG